MMSIILSVSTVLAWIFFGLTPILCNFTTNNLIHLYAIIWRYVLYVFAVLWLLLKCINEMLAAIERYQQRNEMVDEVKGTIVKREAKKGFFTNSYKTTIAYEGMSVSTNSYALYKTGREGDNVNVVLRTRTNSNRVSRYLSLD